MRSRFTIGELCCSNNPVYDLTLTGSSTTRLGARASRYDDRIYIAFRTPRFHEICDNI